MVKHNRMIFDIDEATQMAIRLRAVKNGCTTGEVVEEAVRNTFPVEVEEAVQVKGQK